MATVVEPSLESPNPLAAQAARARRSVSDLKLEKRLCRLAGQAIGDFNMIEDGDRVMVCMSGGKDSYGLLDILVKLRARAPIRFDLVAVNLDQKQPGFPADVLPAYLSRLGVPFHIETQDTYSIVKRLVPEGKTTCSLCSRLRRGALYRVATELGANKVALGHHADDLLETFFLNLFYAGRMKGMPPKLVSDDGKHLVIRPLAYVRERDLVRWAVLQDYPIIPCDLCGSQENLKRREMKSMLRAWEQQFPGRIKSIAAAMQSVTPSHLMDRSIHPFETLKAGGIANPDGDVAFDDDPCTTAPDLGRIDIASSRSAFVDDAREVRR